MWWIFAATSLLHLYVVARCFHYLLRYYYAPVYFRSVLITALISALMSTSAFFAWWTIWKKMHTARFWAIFASGVSILIFLRELILPSQPSWDHHFGALVIGVVGVVVFCRTDNLQSSPETAMGPGPDAT
jgi:hypothetical protein